MKKHILFSALFLFYSLPAFAVDSDLQEWTTFTFTGPKAEKLRGYMEVQPRFGTNISRMYTIMVRPALMYQLTENSSVWLGHAWTPIVAPVYKDEQRLWQQYSILFPFSGFTLASRTRIEERWISGVSSVAMRLRQNVRFVLPLCQSEAEWSLIAWDEIFFHLNSPTASIEAGYNQNRLFIGAGRLLYPGIKAEAGYLMNHVSRVGLDAQMNHVIVTTINVTF